MQTNTLYPSTELKRNSVERGKLTVPEIISKKTLAVCIDIGTEVINEMVGDSISSSEEHARCGDLMAAAIVAQLNI